MKAALGVQRRAVGGDATLTCFPTQNDQTRWGRDGHFRSVTSRSIFSSHHVHALQPRAASTAPPHRPAPSHRPAPPCRAGTSRWPLARGGLSRRCVPTRAGTPCAANAGTGGRRPHPLGSTPPCRLGNRSTRLARRRAAAGRCYCCYRLRRRRSLLLRHYCCCSRRRRLLRCCCRRLPPPSYASHPQTSRREGCAIDSR